MEMMHEFHTAVNIISITVLIIKLAVAFTFIGYFLLRILLIMVALKKTVVWLAPFLLCYSCYLTVVRCKELTQAKVNSQAKLA